MGFAIAATCRACGSNFMVDKGGGTAFHLLRCDKCGKTREISFVAMGETYLRFIKGLDEPFYEATAEDEGYIRERYAGTPLKAHDYFLEVERTAGACSCGGEFTLTAPPRCPRCHATEIRLDPEGLQIAYD